MYVVYHIIYVVYHIMYVFTMIVTGCQNWHHNDCDDNQQLSKLSSISHCDRNQQLSKLSSISHCDRNHWRRLSSQSAVDTTVYVVWYMYVDYTHRSCIIWYTCSQCICVYSLHTCIILCTWCIILCTWCIILSTWCIILCTCSQWLWLAVKTGITTIVMTISSCQNCHQSAIVIAISSCQNCHQSAIVIAIIDDDCHHNQQLIQLYM